MGSIKMVLNMWILSLPSEQIGKEMFDMLSMANQSTEEMCIRDSFYSYNIRFFRTGLQRKIQLAFFAFYMGCLLYTSCGP